MLGRIVPEFNRPDLREVIFRNYCIVYLLQDIAVFTLQVAHNSRDLLVRVRREPWELEAKVSIPWRLGCSFTITLGKEKYP